MIMSLYTTSVCNLTCSECIMQFQMGANKKYHMSLEELSDFLKYSIISGYNFQVLLSGGEPLLWKNLEAGLKMLRNSPAIDKITMFSNSMYPDKVTKDIIDNLDIIRVSYYEHNESHMQELKNKWPDKVEIVDKQEFWANPKVAVPKEIAMPVECLNAPFHLYDRNVYACSHCNSLSIHSGAKVKMCNPLGINFLNNIMELKKGLSEEVCTWCISNKKVRDYVEKVDNTDKSNKFFHQLVQIGSK